MLKNFRCTLSFFTLSIVHPCTYILTVVIAVHGIFFALIVDVHRKGLSAALFNSFKFMLAQNKLVQYP
jgi:hypothetical protein